MREPFIYREVEFHFPNEIDYEMYFNRRPFSLINKLALNILVWPFKKYVRALERDGYDFRRGAHMALLIADGKNNGGIWSYGDGRDIIPVQSWIDSIDGRVSPLLVCCCNPDNQDIYAQRSVVIHPSSYIRPFTSLFYSRMRVFLPNQGYFTVLCRKRSPLKTPYQMVEG